MAEQIDNDRRRILGVVVLSIAAAELVVIGSADAQSRKINPIKPGTSTSFASLKQIDAGLLNVGYAEAGPANIDAHVKLTRLLASSALDAPGTLLPTAGGAA